MRFATRRRYNQTVDGLIAQPIVDSVQSLVPLSNGLYTYESIYQNANIGSVRNQGWELQGTTVLGPLTAHSTYSAMKSRMIGLTEAYRTLTQRVAGIYTPGASFQLIPEHTWAFGVSYAQGGTTMGINVNGQGPIYVSQDDFVYATSSLYRLYSTRIRIGHAPGYVNQNRGYALADLNATHQFSPFVDGVLQVLNMGNTYRNDYSPFTPVIGRQSQIGVRVRW